MYNHFLKRVLDIAGAICGLAVFGVPMLVIAAIVKNEDSGPALFMQKRIGQKKNGAITYFQILKFRTMKLSAPRDIPTHLMKESDRYLLKCGKTLRKYSLDELPQLVNILKGDMSFIGPRPALWNQDDLIAEREKYGANDCKPGLTGWAQINGRDQLGISEKAKLDGDYAEQEGFLMDAKCFLRTIKVAVKAEGFDEGNSGARNKENSGN